MGNFEQALKEMNEEWINSLPNPDELSEIALSDNFNKYVDNQGTPHEFFSHTTNERKREGTETLP